MADDGQTVYFQQATDLLYSNFKGPKEYSPSDILTLMKCGLFRLFVLLLPDKKHPGKMFVAGTAFGVVYFEKQAMHLEYLAVSDQCQGMGLGTLILRYLRYTYDYDNNQDNKNNNNQGKQRFQGQSKLKLLTLECSKKLTGYYQKLGARDSGLTQVWQLDNGSGAIQTCTYHFLYFEIGEAPLIDHPSGFIDLRKNLKTYQDLGDLLVQTDYL